MKRFVVVLAILFVSAYTTLVVAKHFWRGTTMGVDTVCKKWGETAFNKTQFKSGTEDARAKMACSLLKNQKEFRGKHRREIRKELGGPDGFYFTDMFPAYMITPAGTNEDSWQIVFILDRKEQVSEIIVHKNCCDK